MARAKVEQVRCDRCKRVDLVPVKEGDAKKGPDFLLNFGEKAVVFEDLCVRCRETLDNYMYRIEEWERDGKPLVGELPSDPEKVPQPVDNPHSHNTPNPHSAKSRDKDR